MPSLDIQLAKLDKLDPLQKLSTIFKRAWETYHLLVCFYGPAIEIRISRSH